MTFRRANVSVSSEICNIVQAAHLHLSLGLQPEAKYFTRSVFVSFSAATAGFVAEGAIAILGLKFSGLILTEVLWTADFVHGLCAKLLLTGI